MKPSRHPSRSPRVPSDGAPAGAPGASPGTGTPDEVQGLRERVASLNTRLLARTQVAYAEGVLTGRYGLSGREEAFALMKTASQRWNVKLHRLAAALAVTRAPARGAAQWFPHRVVQPTPSLHAVGEGLSPFNQGEVLAAALRRVLRVTGGTRGSVQLYEAGLLRLEQQQGYTQRFRDHLACVDADTAYARALIARSRITVLDTATATDFDEEMRGLLLSEDVHALVNVPVTGHDGAFRGVISSLHDTPPTPLDGRQLRELEDVANAVGRWLAWHQHSVVLAALEFIHQSGRVAARPPEGD